MAKIKEFGAHDPYEIFAAVTTKNGYEVSFHETISDAQEEAVDRCGNESVYWVEDGKIVVDSRACPDYSCYADRVSSLIVSEIKSMTTSDIAGLAGLVKAWSDAFQSTMSD